MVEKDDRVTKICAGVKVKYGMCNGCTGHGVCEFVNKGRKPVFCPLLEGEYDNLPDIPVEGLLDTILVKNQYICNLCHKPVSMDDKKIHSCRGEQ